MNLAAVNLSPVSSIGNRACFGGGKGHQGWWLATQVVVVQNLSNAPATVLQIGRYKGTQLNCRLCRPLANISDKACLGVEGGPPRMVVGYLACGGSKSVRMPLRRCYRSEDISPFIVSIPAVRKRRQHKNTRLTSYPPDLEIRSNNRQCSIRNPQIRGY